MVATLIMVYSLGIILSCLIYTSEGLRCLDCTNVLSPHDCAKVIECGVNENCFTEQFVTSNGEILFNSGCYPVSHCSKNGIALIGKRDAHVGENKRSSASINQRHIHYGENKRPVAPMGKKHTLVGENKRSTDITLCIECCSDNFCNRNGCGVKEIAHTQRGPYCFTCDAAVDAKACTNVTVCQKDELCMLYTPVEYNALPQVIYKSICETQRVCEMIAQTFDNHNCPPTCCNSDFCNDKCAKSMTTTNSPQITTTTTTTKTTTNKATKPMQTTQRNATHAYPTAHPGSGNVCIKNYIHLQNERASLNVHIVCNHGDYNTARHACQKEGGDLVVLDTLEKSLLLRSKLLESDHHGYWIGIRDFGGNNHFSYISANHTLIDNSEADWRAGQPDHESYGVRQNCVVMLSSSRYQWHDTDCNIDHFRYICERP